MTSRLLSSFIALAVVATPSLAAFAQGQPQKPAQPPPAAAEPKPMTAVGEAADKDEIPPVPVADKTIKSWREAIQLASAEDVNYSISILEVERSRGIERQTLAGTLPQLDAQGVLTFNLLRQDVDSVDFTTGERTTVTVPSSPTASVSVSLRQPLIAPRVWYAIGTAEKQTELAKTAIKDNKRVLVAAVADAIVTVVTAERAAEVNRVGVKASLDRLKLQKKRRELGAGSDLDIIRFRQDVVAARGTV
ncbi:MAG: TolC family protein, partial [Myxococcales bacterium]|nr:TolC family protein [Myxococcales bacterium]